MKRVLFQTILTLVLSRAALGQTSIAPPTTQATTSPAISGEQTLRPFDGIAVIINQEEPAQSRVEITGFTCLDSGWLEQVACAPATREHESLVVIKPKPSQIHAALLMAGFEPGAPGRWIYENHKFDIIKPTGENLDILVRYLNADGKTVEHEIGKWIREAGAKQDQEPKPFPLEPFIFGGSRFETVPPPPLLPGGEGGETKDAALPAKTFDPKTNPASAPASKPAANAEQYVADMSGSIIGLVTFGDEMIGFSVVRSDQEAVQEPTWEANPESLPPIETPVTLIIRKWKN